MNTAIKYKAYPKYRPSGIDWLGHIPEGWGVKRFNYLISNIVDKATGSKESEFIVALENIESWTGNLLLSDDQKLPEGDLKRFLEGDVLFGKLRPYLAKALLAEQRGLCVGEALVLRSKKELLSKFLIYRILTNEFINYIDGSTQGAKMPRAEWEFIKTLQIAYPPIEDQKRIVDFIDRETAKIDGMVAKKKKMIQLLKEKKQALIAHFVTKGLDPKRKMQPSGVDWLGDIPEGWGVKKLGHLLDYKKGIKIGPFGSQLTLDEMVDSGYKVYGQENVINNDFELGKRYISESKFREMIVYEIRPTDLLITMMGTTGNCQIVPKNISQGIMDSHLIRIRFNEKKMLSLFAQILVSQANYVKEQIDSIGQGSIMSGLNSSIIKSLVFVVPPINDQRMLIDYIELQNRRIDEMIKKVEAHIEKLQEYRQALITSAMTGKIMVN